MVFRPGSADRLAWGVGSRAVLVAVSAFFSCYLLWPSRHYVTAVFLAACAVGLCLSTMRSLRRAQGNIDQQLIRLAVEYGDVPARMLGGTGAAAGEGVITGAGASTFDQVARVLAAGRAERQQQLEYVQTLLDTVSAALVVVDEDGRVELVNRSARVLAGAPVTRLEEMKAVGAQAAGQLLALAPGTRKVLDLPDGRQMFVSVAQLSSSLHGRRRMLSLHAIAGELDAVELKAWKDMAGVLAHEIMNSLTAISSLSESLGGMLQQGAGAEVADALESIQRRSLGLLDFVERYRLIMDMPAPRKQLLSMSDLLAGIESLLGQDFRQKGIVFVKSVEPPDLTCRADPHLLEQALINLLKNSVEAVSEVPDPRIEVTCQAREDVLVLDIADNGRGLVGEVSGRGSLPVFTTRSGGSGIGLHLVRQIALSHGGQLEARKNQPRGSIFTLSLLKA